MLSLAWGLSSAALAHPIHRSIAEADFRRETGTLEVALRVYADDFEAALSARAKKKVSLEKTPAAELVALAHAYITETFTIKSAKGTRIDAIRWIGRELKEGENELWFYFEVPIGPDIEGVRLLHQALADQFRDQLNSILVRDGDRKTTLVFLPNHTEKTVRFAR